MKKIMKIELMDGSILERDFTHAGGIPIGEPANGQHYANLCQAVAQYGYTDERERKIDGKFYKHIAPAFIKTVSMEFKD